MDWHEKKTFKFIIPFYLKDGWGNRVCPEASGDTATLWSIRACDGFCIDQENVGWWSRLEGARVGGWALGFLWWLPHYTDVVKNHSNLSVVVIVIIIPAEVIITLSFLHPASFGTGRSPLLRVWEAAAITLKEGRQWKARSVVERIKE